MVNGNGNGNSNVWIRNPDQMAPDAELPLSNGSNLIL
jgi:hypothetical protein